MKVKIVDGVPELAKALKELAAFDHTVKFVTESEGQYGMPRYTIIYEEAL